ncbi:hypothetical protein GGR50DRAFT_520700 [Xylaria sp. CBS 124048]|nr:hypothetical protein GGR50DRAFT_520700 [Xylaria sp. CBS 124048]
MGPCWDRVGTDEETRNEHLSLEECLSYDEMMLSSSLMGVSEPSFFINDGRQRNLGRPAAAGDFEPRGIIIELVGARFERESRMDSVYVTADGNSIQHPELRDIFLEFFGRGQEDGAPDFIDSLEELSSRLSHIGTVEFAWIGEVLGWKQCTMMFGTVERVIDVSFSRRSPAEKLSGPDADQLLVLSYAWDGNAFPGNEYWVGSLSATGDPAAACMSTISELHNPLVNPEFLDRIEVVSMK